MKKIITLLVALVVVGAVDAKPKSSATIDMRVGSYNVWSHLARNGQIRKGRADEARSWSNSKYAVAKLIDKLNCDIIGMQEVTTVCRDDLATLVKKSKAKRYDLWWIDTYPLSKKKNIGNAVFYNTKKFTLEPQGIYYFSLTPEKPSSGWDEKRFMRAAMTAVVTHNKSGKKFYFIATHGPLGDIANGHAGRLLVEFDKKYNTEGLPTIVVGDMNANPNMEFYDHMTKHFEDCFKVAKQKCGTIGTFNGAAGTDKNFSNSKRRIDHIYVRSTDKGKIEVKDYTVNRDKYKVAGKLHYPSDHNPVVVDLKLK